MYCLLIYAKKSATYVKFYPPKKHQNDCVTGVSRGVHEHEQASTSPAALILESVRRHKRLGINVIPRNTTSSTMPPTTFNTFIAPEKSLAICKTTKAGDC